MGDYLSSGRELTLANSGKRPRDHLSHYAQPAIIKNNNLFHLLAQTPALVLSGGLHSAPFIIKQSLHNASRDL